MRKVTFLEFYLYLVKRKKKKKLPDVQIVPQTDFYVANY